MKFDRILGLFTLIIVGALVYPLAGLLYYASFGNIWMEFTSFVAGFAFGFPGRQMSNKLIPFLVSLMPPLYIFLTTNHSVFDPQTSLLYLMLFEAAGFSLGYICHIAKERGK